MSAAQHLTRSGQRHEWLADLAVLLDAIIVGEAAAGLLADGDLDAATGLARLPNWCFGHSAIKLGRKDRADRPGPDGQTRLLMPLRISWSPGPLVLVHHRPISLSWTLHSLGHHGAGITEVRCVPDGERPPVGSTDRGVTRGPFLADGTPEAHAYVRCSPALVIRRDLQALVAAGTAARWELVQQLEEHVTKAVAAASNVLAEELRTNRVMDTVNQLDVVNEIVYGTGTNVGVSAVFRLIDRLTVPTTFNSVDPSMYIRVDLHRTAREAVRRYLGDPKVGDRVRAVFREHQPATLDEFLEIYKALYPNDRLAEKRALAALSAGASVMAQALELASFDQDDDQ